MVASFLHGIETIELQTGTRPIRVVRASVIGLIGTAPNADADLFPLNTPVLIKGKRTDAAGLGTDGTLPAAIDDIFDQAGALTVVVRVEEGATDAETLSNIIGGIDPVTGAREGVQAFLDAQAVVKVTPKLLVAPEFSQNAALVGEMITIAERLKAMIFADGPNGTDAGAITYREQFGSDRVVIIDPWVKVWDTESSSEMIRPPSARAVGAVVRNDQDQGWWHPTSKLLLNGVLGLARPIDYALSDPNSAANLLNENQVCTIIQYGGGYHLFGNDSCASDPLMRHIKRRRVRDMIGISIQEAHFWALDRNVTSTYVENVLDGIDAFGQKLVALGAIPGFRVWANPELNSPEELDAGRFYVDYDFIEYPTARHIVFRNALNKGYWEELIPTAA